MSDTDQDPNREPEYTGPIAWMARKPIAANLLMVILLAGGVWMMFNIQKEVFPESQLDVVNVGVTYPGASPSEVESGVLQPVEEAIRGIEGIKEVTSTAREGGGSVSVELVAGTNRMKSFQEIDQAVNRIRTFPDNIEEPEVQLQSREREVIEFGVYGEIDIWHLRKLGERIRDRLLSQPEITQVQLNNVPDYETSVEIPQHTLRTYNLTLGSVAARIEGASRDVPAGAIETRNGEILLRMKERKQWAEEFGSIGIVTSEQGSSVTLSDIAQVEDEFVESGFHSRFNEKPSIELEIFRVGTQSPLEIASVAKSTFENIQFPPGVQYRIDSNRARDFGDRLSLLMKNGLLAILIVLSILTLFLEYRLAFWVMMGMTISFVGSFLFLPMLGMSINMISMFAFLVVLGIVVDDAIVVGENVYEYRERGMDLVPAAIEGTRDMAGPVTFSILSNIVAFIPLMFVPGTTGNFWFPIPVVVITVLLISLFEALFILPAHLGHRTEDEDPFPLNWLHSGQQRFSSWFKEAVDRYFRPVLTFCLNYRYITLTAAVTLLSVVIGYAYSSHMGMITMPEVSADEIEAGVRLPVDTTQDQAAEKALSITESSMKMFEEHNLYEVAEGIKTNVRGQTFIDVEIVMKPANERDMTAKEVIDLWRNELGDIEGVDQMTFEAERGPGGWRDDISVDLSHADITTLEEASQVFFKRAQQFQATRDVNDNYSKGKPQLDFTLREEGRMLGLTPAQVGQQLRGAFFGELALRQLRGTNEIEVRVKLPHSSRKQYPTLENFVVRTDTGVEVPLMDIAELERGNAYNEITRRDGRRVINVGMDVEPKREISRVLSAIRSDVLPQLRSEFPGLTWTFQGGQSEMRESAQVLWGGFALAMIVIYALLAVAFESYVQPLIVMIAIPFGIVGAVLGHILLGFNLSLISLMGVIALSGVVVNDSLIMVDYANRLTDDSTAFGAIQEAGVRRFRPILLTTLTTFGGLTPIILETSRQATYLIPMAISLGFGILFATSIILVIVPCLYMVGDDLVGMK
jgi:multidrug efflux pump subunit AcrB